MKKRKIGKVILAISLNLSLLFGILSSDTKAQDLGLGFKAGLDFSTQLNNFRFESGDLNLNLNPNFSTGYQLGLIYRNRIARNFRLQAEPAFLRIGARYNESFTFRNFEFQTDSETTLYYIHLPLTLELTTTPPDLEEFPTPWEETTYHATFGLYGSYLLEATFSGVNTGAPIGIEFEEEFSNDVTSQFNEYDAGFIIGGGLEYGNQNKIGIETRLMLGILSTDNSNKTELKPDNLSISFAVYYLL